MRADLDTLVIALYCAACALFPSERTPRRGRPERSATTSCSALMVAQMLLQCPSDRRFLRRARRRLGHLFPYLPRPVALQRALPTLAPKLVLLWKAIAAETFSAPATICVCSTRRRCLAASRSRRPAQPARALGRLRLLPGPLPPLLGLQARALVRPGRHDRDFDLVAANAGEREAALTLLEANPIEGERSSATKASPAPSSRPPSASCAPCCSGPAAADEPDRPNPPIGWIRQRIESIVNTLKDQLLLERHGARTPAGLLARVTARILALCACVNLNQRLGLTSRTLTPYTN